MFVRRAIIKNLSVGIRPVNILGFVQRLRSPREKTRIDSRLEERP